jgi:hypothetical protein
VLEPALEISIQRYNNALDRANATRNNRGQHIHLDAHALSHGLRQDVLSLPIMEADYDDMVEVAATPEDRVRLISAKDSESFGFLTAVPNEHYKTKMAPQQFISAVELRLGCLSCEGARCNFCGHSIDACGVHATTCKGSGFTKVRHNIVRDTVNDLFIKSGMSTSLEQRGLVLNNQMKPADIYVSGLSGSGFAPVDVAVISPNCPTHINNGLTRGEVTRRKDREKRDKYRPHGVNVIPFVLNVYGGLSPSARFVLKRVMANFTMFNVDISTDGFSSLRRFRKLVYQS